MEKRILFTMVMAAGFVLLDAKDSWAQDYAVPGQHQNGLDDGDGPGDWNPPTAPLMTETDPNGNPGVFDLALSGLDPNARYQFKILEDDNNDPQWGDTEITPTNSWMLSDGTGATAISLNTNTFDDGFLPTTNRVTSSFDTSTIAGFFATGNWMDEAGGAGDWDPGDLLFQLADQGSGLYSIDVTISVPGAYEWKATKGDFDGQWGTDGRNVNAASWNFNTVEPNQDVTFLLDISKGAVSFDTATFTPGDVNNDTFVDPNDYAIIRDNFLNNTFIRSEGDLTGDGIVDVADFREWKENYVPVPEAPEITFVPEPGTFSLFMLAGCGIGVYRRRRQQHQGIGSDEQGLGSDGSVAKPISSRQL